MGDDRATLAKRMIGMIDLTDLADDHSPAGIDELCARAALHGTAAVCVWPEHVERCASELAGTRIRIATVVNFPSGDEAIMTSFVRPRSPWTMAPTRSTS